ncbi:MAG: histidinol-phosphate transaminase [Pyrinomonadaceae bacterium]
MTFELEKLVRENIKALKPYSSARSEFSGTAEIFLDANENSFGSPFPENFNRYPDPMQVKIKEKIGRRESVFSDGIFVGNGSDEAIDLLFRVFCRPKIDNVLICPPTYGMYEISAAINDTEVKKANLTEDFELDPQVINSVADPNTKLLFICSPNNPTGNSLDREVILEIIRKFNGIVVIDEAYVHFSGKPGFISEIENFENIVVLRTFSKAWGLAGLRVGLAFANPDIIDLFNKVKPPYNVSEIAQRAILEALENEESAAEMISAVIKQRAILAEKLSNLKFVKKIYPSDANFILVKTDRADAIYELLIAEKIVVRNRSRVEMCEGCLRITVGTEEENNSLIRALKKYEESIVY